METNDQLKLYNKTNSLSLIKSSSNARSKASPVSRKDAIVVDILKFLRAYTVLFICLSIFLRRDYNRS